MRLLFLNASTTLDGTADVFAVVAVSLADRGHEVSVVAPDDTPLAQRLKGSRGKLLPLDRARTLRQVTTRLVEAIEESHADTVFVHSDDEHFVAAKALSKVGRGGLVRRIGAGVALSATTRARRAERAWPTRYMYTTESPPTGHAAPSGKLSPLRVELGVDVPAEEPTYADEADRLVCIATQGALRRATNVVRAAAMLAQRHHTLRLRVIGSAAADPDLQVLASALGMARRIDWVPVPGDWSPLLRGAAAGWVVADGDEAALGLLRLMAHGVVPLAEKSPVAARYATADIHGVLFSHLDPAAMAAETTLLLADAARRRTMGLAGRARVEREFAVREMLAGFEQAARVVNRRTPVAS